MFTSQGISVRRRIVRPCTTTRRVHCLPVAAHSRRLFLLLLCLARKPKFPEGKTEGSRGYLLNCSSNVQECGHKSSRSKMQQFSGFEKRCAEDGGIKSVNCSGGDRKKM